MSIKKIAISFLIGGLFAINGCGGGGSGSSLPDKPAASEMQKINDSNADKSIKGSLESFKSTSSLNDNAMPGANLRLKNKLAKVARLSVYKSLREVDLSSKCDSGSIKANEISDTEATVTYNKCSINGTLYNGKVSYKIALDENNQLKELKATFDNFNAHNSIGNYDIKYAILYANNDSDETSISKMYATFTENDGTEKYLNFNISEKNGSVKFKGYIKPKCLDGYVYVESLPDIQDGSGKFKIESNGQTITIEFDNETVTITKPSGAVETMSTDEFEAKLDEEC